MAFVKRFGGWRPVQFEEGRGEIELGDGRRFPEVGYRFEVWHQMVDGFPGPFRAEGRVELEPPDQILQLMERDSLLRLEDGRWLPVRLGADRSLLAHARPAEERPWPPSSETPTA